MIAFSAQVGGVTDLFTYDLERSELRRLTDDPYADLEPAWSPDGSVIAFVTDRFSTSLDALSFGDYQLAVIDPRGSGSGQIRQLPHLAHAKHINPQWSPDGQSLYFIGDPGGISNGFRPPRSPVLRSRRTGSGRTSGAASRCFGATCWATTTSSRWPRSRAASRISLHWSPTATGSRG